MTTARKQKVEEAKKLLSEDKASFFADVTEEELAYLQKYNFDVANFMQYATARIFTHTAEEEEKCSAILKKITHGYIIHITLHRKKNEDASGTC